VFISADDDDDNGDDDDADADDDGRWCTAVTGSFAGQISELEDETEQVGSDVVCLVSELEGRLCLRANSNEADDEEDDDGDDDDDDDDACSPSQV